MNIDVIDRQIISALNEDGRISLQEVAGRMGVAENTIRNHVRKLLASGKVKVAGLINPDDSPDKQLMLLGVNITSSKNLTKTAEAIAKLDGVESAYITSGRYDIMVEVWLDSKGGLIKFLSQTLSAVTGITSTESFLVMKSYNKWIQQPDL